MLGVTREILQTSLARVGSQNPSGYGLTRRVPPSPPAAVGYAEDSRLLFPGLRSSCAAISAVSDPFTMTIYPTTWASKTSSSRTPYMT